MSLDLRELLLLAAALGSGLMAGLFFAFSNFVMRALDRTGPARAVATMQAINRTVLNPLFLGSFVGTAALGVALAGLALLRWEPTGLTATLIGAVAYVLGTFAVTAARNVPLNDRLAEVDAEGPRAGAAWEQYRREWTRWNHVRTLASVVAMVAFIRALD